MLKNSLIIAAAVASIAGFASAPAKADPHVSVGIGFGFGGYGGPGFGFYDGGYDDEFGDGYGYEPHRFHHRHHYTPIMEYRAVSCGEGASILRHSGFHGVTAYDCGGPTYGYQAWKHGEQFEVRVSSRGRIISVDPAY